MEITILNLHKKFKKENKKIGNNIPNEAKPNDIKLAKSLLLRCVIIDPLILHKASPWHNSIGLELLSSSIQPKGPIPNGYLTIFIKLNFNQLYQIKIEGYWIISLLIGKIYSTLAAYKNNMVTEINIARIIPVARFKELNFESEMLNLESIKSKLKKD